jgi:uncharacterized protein with ParB-like and HNH nuclease domain
MREIGGEAKTVRQLLSGTRYGIDYYQREYRWQTKQVRELIEDLSASFLEGHSPEYERSAVQNYGHYFLGSIILSRRGNDTYIVDGQQRLTTLSLLLIYLHNRQGARADRVKLDDLVFSEKYGKKSFNIDVAERTLCMESLFAGEPFDMDGQPESVMNIAHRFEDINELFPEEINEPALPFFADWLIENVHLVEISASADEDAYAIFETMNDRGLSLTPLDMLKGYVLANITDEERRIAASDEWKRRVGDLLELGKDEDADAVKAWLRSQYANTIRERRRAAEPGDFDRLGTEFHRWVKENDSAIGLASGSAYADFVERDMRFYTKHYLRLRKASRSLTTGLETVYYIARLEFTLQYPVLLAPLEVTDDDDVVAAKLRATSAFLDILLARRLWNFRSIAYSTMQYAMFLVMRDVRRRPIDELVEVLTGRVDAEDETFLTNDRFRLHQQNRRAVHQMLARMTDYVERSSGLPSRFPDYVAEGRNRFEVEHIWADHAEDHDDEFAHPADFAEYRNRIGDLLLLPKSFNASYGDLPYKEKLEHYNTQNLLARSLHPLSYERNPGFIRFVESSGLSFRPHAEFKRADLDARQDLYRGVAEHVWAPSRIHEEAGATAVSAE